MHLPRICEKTNERICIISEINIAKYNDKAYNINGKINYIYNKVCVDMKLKVVVLDHDIEFIKRLAAAFQKQYEDKISLLLFSDENTMYESMQRSRADLLLVGHSIDIDTDRLPKNIVIGCFCEAPDVGEIDGIPAICKYQRVESIYKAILDIYAENSENILLKRDDSGARRVLFTSVQGGCGTSSVAVAYALRRAQEGNKVFYLNLEKFGDSDLYFNGVGSSSFSDVIYALKSKTGNLELKLESIIQTDPSGVDYFHTCKNAYDMLELQNQEVESLLSCISRMKEYDEIIIDFSGDDIDRITQLIQNSIDRVIYITDGSATGNGKFERFCEVVRVLEQRNEYNILDKMVLLYSRYSSKTSVQLDKTAVPVIGGIHRFEGAAERELIQEIARIEIIGMI